MEINLLPPQQFKKIKLAKLFQKTTGLIILAFFINFAGLGYLYSLNLKLKNKLDGIKNEAITENTEEKVQNLEHLEEKVKETYGLVEKAKKINQENPLQWSEILKELVSFCGAGIKFKKILVDEKNLKEIKVTGVAISREEVMILKNKLEESIHYQEVNFPISNLTSKTDVMFEFTLKLKNE
ncbi:MAG: hypothetical protein U9Q72_03005 [Patescibacteria group bacterium]|nr:hypothetical protein [Patescibacteria group bacterium]